MIKQKNKWNDEILPQLLSGLEFQLLSSSSRVSLASQSQQNTSESFQNSSPSICGVIYKYTNRLVESGGDSPSPSHIPRIVITLWDPESLSSRFFDWTRRVVDLTRRVSAIFSVFLLHSILDLLTASPASFCFRASSLD